MHAPLNFLKPVFRAPIGAYSARFVVEEVSRHLAPHHMIAKQERALDTELRLLDLGKASLVYISYGTDVVISPNRVDDYLAHFALAGSGVLIAVEK